MFHPGFDNPTPADEFEQEFYQALKERSVPTQLVLYPREGHPILEREHQRDLLERRLAWYNWHLLAWRLGTRLRGTPPPGVKVHHARSGRRHYPV